MPFAASCPSNQQPIVVMDRSRPSRSLETAAPGEAKQTGARFPAAEACTYGGIVSRFYLFCKTLAIQPTPRSACFARPATFGQPGDPTKWAEVNGPSLRTVRNLYAMVTCQLLQRSSALCQPRVKRIVMRSHLDIAFYPDSSSARTEPDSRVERAAER
ncbi:hypothetical protein MRX96_007365 [Rhipicephalus microplus]